MSANSKRIVLAGGSGFIGGALAKDLCAQNFEVVTLTRAPRVRKDGVREVQWNGEHIGQWIQFLDGAEAIVNLTGKNVNCPHTPDNLREILDSRIHSIRVIAQALEHASKPPQVWIQAGAIGFYGDQKGRICDEESPNGNGALADICRQCEDAFNSVNAPKTRKVLLRIGFVLGRSGGALPVLEKLTKNFIGGSAGNGQQFVSWIHVSDLARMFVNSIRENFLHGIFNAVAPNPVTNKEFMRELRRVLNRPWSPPAPEWVLKMGARLINSEPSLALAGCRVSPKKNLETGFKFQFSELRHALKNLYE